MSKKLNGEEMFALVAIVTLLPFILLYRFIIIAALTAWLWAIPVAILILVLK